jgi:hypothetical protein
LQILYNLVNISSSYSFNPAACHLHTCNRSTAALQFFGIVTQTFLNFCLFSFQEFEKFCWVEQNMILNTIKTAKLKTTLEPIQ